MWLFGYGSLIWRPNIEYVRSSRASLRGYCRRFWQASRDHRGTPEAPGRVVTLVRRDDDEVVHGVAYEISPSALAYLDHREKGGYSRLDLAVRLEDPPGEVRALVYVGSDDNEDYAPCDDDDAIAAVVARAHGPSGPNRDYLFGLAEALRGMGVRDEHVEGLERRVRATRPV